MTESDELRRMYDDHAGDVFGYLARRVGRQLAEDLTAETFRRAVENASTFDPELGNRRAWLYGIATNLVRGHRRTEATHLRAIGRATTSSNVAHTDPVDDRVAGRIDAQTEASAVLMAVTSLDAADRDLLILAGWQRLSSREIAEVLDIEPGAVRVRLHRVRSRLRALMADTDTTHNRTPEQITRPREGERRTP